MHNLSQLNSDHIVFIKLLIAHFVADFVLQTKSMVKNKGWFSRAMFSHIGVVYLTAALFSFLWWQSLFIAFIHYIIDGFKIELTKRYKQKDIILFIGDQLLHLLTLVVICALNFNWYEGLINELNQLFLNGKLVLLILGYLIITYPVGYLIGLSTQKMNHIADKKQQQAEDKNGMKIGIFERVIILTFVLLGQYEAIGFLITGKSLLRFAYQNEAKTIEYVLLGTMMSYAITIGIGVLLNMFLN